MRLLWTLAGAATLLITCTLALDGYVVPPGSPGYQHGNSTQRIQFDSTSLYIDGKRVFLFGGEFHFWRLPVPALWSDILEKLKASGQNTVSIYVHWGITEGKQRVRDWNEWRSVDAFLQVAKEVGIYVVARPGPYINAETTGGGLPGWLTNSPARARSNDTLYTEAWSGYVKEFSQIVSKYQYPDGPVIAVQVENEFFESSPTAPTTTQYMSILEPAFRDGGITRVPLIVNDVWPSGNYASGHPASVDIYGFDAYPGGFDCSSTAWPNMPDYFISNDAANAPGNPMWFPEFQGGSLANMGGPVGFEGCYNLTGPDFVNVYYKNNVASGSKAMSFYMQYGGTNWGNLGQNGYTSYDYGAAIKESRALTDKYSEVKLQGLFYQASASLYGSTIVGSGGSYTSDSSLFTTQLGNNGFNGSNYYVIRQGSNNVTTDTHFKLNVVTPTGPVTIPQLGGDLVLAGRESKIIVTGYVYGKSTLSYSTTEVLTQTTIDGVDYIVLYAPAGHVVEAILRGPVSATPIVSGSSTVHATIKDSSVTLNGTASSISVVRWGKNVVIILDTAAAYTFWNPRTSSAYDLSPSVSSVIVSGPYLVRSASVSSGTLALVGDLKGPTSITVFAPSTVKSISWNGVGVKVSKSLFGVGLVGSVGTAVPKISVPNLSTLVWKSADSLPEVSPTFDDSQWVVANKTTTTRPLQPGGGKYVLYSDEYGFHAGSTVFRGYFNGTAIGANLWVETGGSGAASVFLNGHFLASNQSLGEDFNFTLSFAPETYVRAGVNVLTVLVENSGLDTDWNADDQFKTPRGIRGYELIGGPDFTVWKLAGTLGGEDYPDKVRGPYNEGGLWAERTGAILPGYDYSHWKEASPLTGLKAAGVAAYRSSFGLSVPDGVDATFAVSFAASATSNFRTLLFINGWQFGRYTNYGPQTVFPIPQGILNHNGSNDIVITLWSLDGAGVKLDKISLGVVQAVSSGKPKISGLVSSPGYTQLR